MECPDDIRMVETQAPAHCGEAVGMECQEEARISLEVFSDQWREDEVTG